MWDHHLPQALKYEGRLQRVHRIEQVEWVSYFNSQMPNTFSAIPHFVCMVHRQSKQLTRD
jgi:hypothetical protein